MVGDAMGSNCGNLACLGGTKLSCNKSGGNWSKVKVTCSNGGPNGFDLRNTGQDCFNHCNQKQGKCNWCGNKGYCCRKWSDKWKLISGGCDGTFGGTTQHECALKPASTCEQDIAKVKEIVNKHRRVELDEDVSVDVMRDEKAMSSGQRRMTTM